MQRSRGGERSERGLVPSFGELAGMFAVVLLAYTAGAVLAWESFGAAFGPAFFYPSAGVTAAAMLLSRRAQWPAIIVAIVLGETLVNVYFWNATSQTAWYALANVLEPLVGASLVLAWCRGVPDLSIRADFGRFVTGACFVGPAVGGLIGGTATAVFRDEQWLISVLKWWSGDALGVLVIASPLLLWRRQSHIVRDRPVETGAVLVLTGILTVAALHVQIPPVLLVLPIIALAAFRLNMLGAALAGAVFAFMTNVMTSRGKDVFGATELSPGSTVAVTQLYVGASVIVALLFAQEVAARTQAVHSHSLERRERLRLEGLSRLAERLSSAMTADDIGRALEDQIINDAGATGIVFGRLNQDGSRLKMVRMSGYPPEVVAQFGSGAAVSDHFVVSEAVRTGKPVPIGSVAEYRARYGDARLLLAAKAEAVLGYPLIAEGKPIGALLLMWSQRQPFDPAQLAYVSTVGSMVSQALARSLRYEDEKERAMVLRSALRPGNPGDLGGVEVHVGYESADSISGLGSDWYDVMTLPTGKTYLAVGDVQGRGLAAVEDMGQLLSAGRALAHQGLSPSRVLAELSRLTRHVSNNKTATMAVAIYDPDMGSVSHCSAGHPPAVLRKAATADAIELAETYGPALGSPGEASYVDAIVSVAPGDILVMYTDGLLQRPPGDGTTAKHVIRHWDPDQDLKSACDALCETLAPRPRKDDLCVMVARMGIGAGDD